jgi:hypothetical protein
MPRPVWSLMTRRMSRAMNPFKVTPALLCGMWNLSRTPLSLAISTPLKLQLVRIIITRILNLYIRRLMFILCNGWEIVL